METYVATLDEWEIQTANHGEKLTGIVSNHPKWPDGTHITVTGFKYYGPDKAETEFTTYKLGERKS